MTTRSGEKAVEIEIKLHIGPRDELRPLFELAEDSAEAVRPAASGSATRVLVATAAADVGNLRFYQQQGFRLLLRVERDAFTPSTGYPPGLVIDGIELRDRVWLDQPVV